MGQVFCTSESDSSGVDSRTFVDPVRQSESYSAVLYNNRNGLPTPEANDIAETGDGFIWIGSYSGLIRYDGNTFHRLDSTRGISGVLSLLVDSRDRLWIGTNDNGLAMMTLGNFHLWSTADGLPSERICDIAEDGKGIIYVGTTEGIVTIDRDMDFHLLADPPLDGIYVEKLYTSTDGVVYGISNSGDAFTLYNGAVAAFLDNSDKVVNGILSILPDKDHPGYVYLGAENNILYYGSLKNGFEGVEKINISPLFGVMNIEQIGEQIWLCARNGIGVLDYDGFHILTDLPLNNNVCSMMADYEGNLWFTSSRQGVMKIVSNQFTNVFERFHLPEEVVNSTCLSDGRLFIGTDTGLIVLDENGPVEKIPLAKAVTASGEDLEETDLLGLLDGVRIRSVIRDSQGRLWISTWRSDGLFRYDRDEVLAFTREDGLFSDRVRAAFEREDGSILVANSGGVCVIEGDRVTERYGKESGIVNNDSLTVVSGRNGDILLGSNGGGIYVINDKGTRCIGREEGLSSGIVMRIKRDPHRDIYWIVTSNSIAYMTEDYQVTTIGKFPYSDNYDLYESNEGDMWVLSSNGIYVLPTEELLTKGNVGLNPVHYTIANGLPCNPTGNAYSELTDDGDLYIAGNTGVAKVNIDSPMEMVSNLKISIPYLEADGVRIYADETGVFYVPPTVHKLTVYSYVFNYSLSDPKISYRLKGFDQVTRTVSRGELDPVDYTNLPGGTYEFEMLVQDSLGHSSKMVSSEIIVEKAIYEETVFIFAITLGAILALLLGIRAYVNRKTRIMAEKNQEAINRERLDTELKMANRIQMSILPHEFPPFPDRKEFEIYASMDPAREVGGDFYDFFLIDADHLCLVIADVSGKGIPASLFMMISKVIVQSCAMLGKHAGEILSKTNEALCSNNKVDMFVTVWIGILEISTGIITAANAGHEYPVLMQNGEFRLLKDNHGLVIGGLNDSVYTEYEIALEPGDKIFVYTDGIPEATDAKNNMFGTERLVQALNENAGAAPQEILDKVHCAVDDFVKDAEQFDDMTMLCMEYRGPAEKVKESE